MPGYRLLHRDIKPSNVGLAGDGRVVLADFALLKIWKRGEDDNERRSLTSMTGSLRYMAPEVALSQPYNHKAEVFSFTSLLYHVLSLEKPFAAMDAKAFVAEACAAKGNRRSVSRSFQLHDSRPPFPGVPQGQALPVGKGAASPKHSVLPIPVASSAAARVRRGRRSSAA